MHNGAAPMHRRRPRGGRCARLQRGTHRRFQRHDEEVLAAQHEVYDDAAAVIQTAREARTELEHLFDADLIEDKAVK